MTNVDRVSTAQQTAYMLGQINKANAALDKTTQQIASGNKATTYAGFGSQTQLLQATISANARNSAYTAATTLASTQADIQDTRLFRNLLAQPGEQQRQAGRHRTEQQRH